MTDTTLLPCPFCEGAASLARCGFGTGRVVCLDCGAEGQYRNTHDDAIAAWNRRPSPSVHRQASAGQEGVTDELTKFEAWAKERGNWLEKSGSALGIWSYEEDETQAAFVAWQACAALSTAAPESGWPIASKKESASGWTLDYKFLERVTSLAASRTEFTTSLEATEQVLIAAREVRAAAPTAGETL